MKAGVITLYNVCNYGTQLQAYATQEKLKEYFEEVEFIQYKRKDTYGLGLLRLQIHHTLERMVLTGFEMNMMFIYPVAIRYGTVVGMAESLLPII